jgi:hypothetical protein
MREMDSGVVAQPSRPAWPVVLTIAVVWFFVAGLLVKWARDGAWLQGWFYFGFFAAGAGLTKACLLAGLESRTVEATAFYPTRGEELGYRLNDRVSGN